MAWTNEDERKFLDRLNTYRLQDEKERQMRRNASSGPKCPECGSRNYIETTKVEVCDDCGYEQSYW